MAKKKNKTKKGSKHLKENSKQFEPKLLNDESEEQTYIDDEDYSQTIGNRDYRDISQHFDDYEETPVVDSGRTYRDKLEEAGFSFPNPTPELDVKPKKYKNSQELYDDKFAPLKKKKKDMYTSEKENEKEDDGLSL